MRPDTKIVIRAGALAEMTTAQFESLKGLAQPGNWETQTEDVHVSGTDYIGVCLTNFFIGIEEDGYTHS